MLKVIKQEEPKFLIQYKKKNSPKSWSDYNKEDIKVRIKENILKNEQMNYCPYCEKIIDSIDDGHIEHIKCRDKFPKEFQNYENLLVSCNEKNSCGMFKGNNYISDFINPVVDNPQDFLEFNMASGEILPKNKDESSKDFVKAHNTIKILNLNSYELKEARKNLIDMLEMYRLNYDDWKNYLQFFLDTGYSFPSLITYYNEVFYEI